MVTIIYKPSKKIIKSSNILYIYDFGYMKGFLMNNDNNDFKLYKILQKEMKESSLYEKCEFLETNIPLHTCSIDKYDYIEDNKILYIHNYSIEFTQDLDVPVPVPVVSSLLDVQKVSSDCKTSFSQQQVQEKQPQEDPLGQQEGQQGLFDQALLKQIHQNSKKDGETKKEQKPVLFQQLSSRMIPLSQLTVRQKEKW